GVILTSVLTDDQGESVAVTQPAGAIAAGSGFAQPVESFRSFTVVLARKYVVFRGTSFPTFVNTPCDVAVAVEAEARRDGDVPCARTTAAPATPVPPSVTRPVTFHVFVFALSDFVSATMAGRPTIARASNVPAALIVPLPGLYGVKSA